LTTVRPASAELWGASGTATGGDGALDASANITFTTGEMQVTITNLLDPSTIRDVGQSVSDLSITLGSGPGTNVEASNTASGNLVDISGTSTPNGEVTAVPGTPGNWISSSTGGFGISGDTITLEAIGHGNNDQLIFTTDKAGFYSNVNPGIDSHNPYTDRPGTFTVDLSDVTSSTTISSVQFSFGTGPDTFIAGHVIPAPPIGQGLPVVLAVGGLLLGFKLWERGQKRRSPETAIPHAAA
jgi:hypothetical protein